MKLKISTNFKIVLSFVAFCLFWFGMMGFMMSAGSNMGKVEIKKLYKQHHLNEKNGIAVDSDGNIYIGEGETGSIQVYDSLGNFQYGFSFPTGGSGWFVFGIEQDKIHIVTARTESYFIFDKGELAFSEKGINNDRLKELQTQYHMNKDNSYITSNKIYKVSSLNTVSIQDKLNGQVEIIHLNVPIWPFPIFVFWWIAAAGMGLLFVLHHKVLLSIRKEIRNNLRLR